MGQGEVCAMDDRDCNTWVDALDQVRRSTEKLKEKTIWLMAFVELEGFKTMDGMIDTSLQYGLVPLLGVLLIVALTEYCMRQINGCGFHLCWSD